MKDRTAIDTIKGYFYQFDYAIAKLLELGTDEMMQESGIMQLKHSLWV